MRRAVLAKALISAVNDADRRRLLDLHPRLADERLGDEIRKVCYASWAVEPVKAQRAAAAIKILSKKIGGNER